MGASGRRLGAPGGRLGRLWSPPWRLWASLECSRGLLGRFWAALWCLRAPPGATRRLFAPLYEVRVLQVPRRIAAPCFSPHWRGWRCGVRTSRSFWFGMLVSLTSWAGELGEGKGHRRRNPRRGRKEIPRAGKIQILVLLRTPVIRSDCCCCCC